MNSLYAVTLVILLLSLLMGVFRIWRGPRMADRIMAAQLTGSTGVAVLLSFSELQNQPAARDTALVLALLAMLIAVAFVSRVWGFTRAKKDS